MEADSNIIEEDKANTTDTALSTKEDVEVEDKENEIPEYVREMIEVRASKTRSSSKFDRIFWKFIINHSFDFNLLTSLKW